jgi:integrase
VSPSAHLIRRQGARGVRWHVRFRWRPSDSRARHFASFERKQDADVARGWVMAEIAHGRYPDPARYFAEPEPSRTLAELHDAWDTGRRHEVGASARKMARQARETYGPLADMDPAAITVTDVRRWIAGLAEEGRAPGTIGAYRSVLRQVLDAADLGHPNPARDPRARLPRQESTPADPPSYRHFLVMCEAVSPRHEALMSFLERTGLRITEALSITWGDVDWRDDLLRVRAGKTRTARRWVPMLPSIRSLLVRVPQDERHPERPIFPGLTANSARSAMRLACEKAGIPTYTPHDLRHRYTSLLVMAGVPAPLVGRIVGHRRVSVTLDTYSHVLMDEPAERLAALRRAAYTVPGAREVVADPTVQACGSGAYTVPRSPDRED